MISTKDGWVEGEAKDTFLGRQERSHEPVGDECKGESYETDWAAENDRQGHQSTLLIPDGGGEAAGVTLRLGRRESMDVTSVQGFHLQNEYQINSVSSDNDVLCRRSVRGFLVTISPVLFRLFIYPLQIRFNAISLLLLFKKYKGGLSINNCLWHK